MNKTYLTEIEATDNMRRYDTNENIDFLSAVAEISDDFSANLIDSYMALNAVTDIFFDAVKSIKNITDENVKRQAEDILKRLFNRLKDYDLTEVRLRKLSAVEREDSSFLIEWSFPKFNVGISLEPTQEDSYYFWVSVDESIDEVETRTRRINGKADVVIDDIVRFVTKNI